MESGTLFQKPQPEERRKLPLQWLIIGPLVVVIAVGFWIYLAVTPPPENPGEFVYVAPEGLARAGDPDFERYRDYLLILDAQGKVQFNFAGDRQVLVQGVFDNRGERAVEAAEIKITFYDPEGEIIRERIAAPLRMETGLKRTLHSLESRAFSVRFDDMPAYLEVGRLEVILHGVRLAPR